MKKLVSILMAACLLALLVGCSNGASSSSSAPATPKPTASSMPGVDGGMSGPMSGGMSGAMSDALSGAMWGAMSGAGSAASGTASSTAKAAAQAAAPAAGEEAWALRLVNANNPLPDDFTIDTASIPGYDSRLFDARAAADLTAMLDAAQKAGSPLYLVSAYRSVQRQTALFQRKVNEYLAQGKSQQEAEQSAAQWVARPGTSEHNLGLAADIVSADWYSGHSDLTADFEQTGAFEWLARNAPDYGFILRYPQGKQEVTGVEYEPWHYRYVGKQAAREITDAGITLEEYLAR